MGCMRQLGLTYAGFAFQLGEKKAATAAKKAKQKANKRTKKAAGAKKAVRRNLQLDGSRLLGRPYSLSASVDGTCEEEAEDFQEDGHGF
jgi:hypothetical protein